MECLKAVHVMEAMIKQLRTRITSLPNQELQGNSKAVLCRDLTQMLELETAFPQICSLVATHPEQMNLRDPSDLCANPLHHGVVKGPVPRNARAIRLKLAAMPSTNAVST